MNVAILTLTVVAAGALSACRFVTNGGAYPTEGDMAIGVTRTGAGGAGDLVPVDALGTSMVEAGGVIENGKLVTVDATGRAVQAGEGDLVYGRALQAAAGEGELIEVLLIPCNGVPIPVAAAPGGGG